MVSDVQVGAFLSGGVDSSAIVALMAKTAGYPVKTYSIGFEGQPDYDELRFASQVAKRFGTDHYERIVRPSDIIDFLPQVVDVFDEPLADATCIPVYFLSEKARENGTVVVLTGDGSDELFAGYRSWQRYIRLYPKYHRYLKLPGMMRKLAASGLELMERTGHRPMRFCSVQRRIRSFSGEALKVSRKVRKENFSVLRLMNKAAT